MGIHYLKRLLTHNDKATTGATRRRAEIRDAWG